MIDKEKCDRELGHKVFKFLESKGLTHLYKDNNLTDEQRAKILDENIYNILDAMGLNMEDPNLIDTPRRVRKYFMEQKCLRNWDYFPKVMTVPNENPCSDKFVLVRDLRLISTCSHHLAPFFGVKSMGSKNSVVFGPGCTIAYIPRDRVLGLSKFQRIVDFLGAVTPNVQETLTKQIGWTISYLMDNNPDVAVFVDCNHSCMSLRSCMSPASTYTFWSHPDGVFSTNSQIRSEFLALARE